MYIYTHIHTYIQKRGNAWRRTQPDVFALVCHMVEGGEEPDESARVHEGAGVACVMCGMGVCLIRVN